MEATDRPDPTRGQGRSAATGSRTCSRPGPPGRPRTRRTRPTPRSELRSCPRIRHGGNGHRRVDSGSTGGRLDAGRRPGIAAITWRRRRGAGYDDVDDHLLLAEATGDLGAGDVLRTRARGGRFGRRIRLSRAQDPFAEETARRRATDRSSRGPTRRWHGEGAARSSTRPWPPPPTASWSTARCPGRSRRKSIIAGYPWFADWGRDTMISIPGVCLATGRAELAREILAHLRRDSSTAG